MARLYTLLFVIACMGVNADDAENGEGKGRGLLRCKLFGACGNYGFQGGYGGYQGGYNSYGGYGGYQGNPPINIGISQSQASSSNGYGGGYYPNYPNNYYQYNGYPGQFGYNRPGYNRYRPYNNQYNGNFNFNGGPGYSGYGQDSFGFGGFYGDDNEDYEDFGRSAKKSKD